MSVFVITHRLNLVLRFIDTTTGKPVSGSELTLSSEGKPLHPMEKEQGTLIFIELERNDFILSISSRSFEPCTMPVRFSELDAQVPAIDIQLIPSGTNISPVPCIALQGCIPGISDLTAVRLGDNSCLIREFDPRKKLITLFNPHRLELNRTSYALIDPDKKRFEAFRVVKRIDDNTIKIDRVLEREFSNYFPIAPIYFGQTSENGNYLLRVRDDSSAPNWLIHYQINQDSHFQCADLRQMHEIVPEP